MFAEIVKVTDKNFDGGFRVINKSDLKSDDILFSEEGDKKNDKLREIKSSEGKSK